MDKPTQALEPRVLKYRHFIRWTGNFFAWLGALSFMLGIFLIGLDLSFHQIANQIEIDTSPNPNLTVALLLLFSSFIYLIVYWRIFRPFILARITVFPDRITVQRGDKLDEILYSEIKSINSRATQPLAERVFQGNGFTLITKNGNRHRFPILLERIEYAIEGIFRNRPDLLPLHIYHDLRTSLVLADHSFARYYELFQRKNLIFTCFYFLAVPFLATCWIIRLQSHEFLIRSVGTYFAWLMSLGFCSAIIIQVIVFKWIGSKVSGSILQRIHIDTTDKRRYISAEHRWMRKLYPIQIICILCVYFIICKYDLNMIGRHKASENSPNFNIKSGETFWVDERYNCVNCKFSLQKGDLILLKNSLPVGVVGLPDETIAINIFDGKRYLSVATETIIPRNNIAVQVWIRERPVTVLINASKVDGLLTKNFPSSERPTQTPMTPSMVILPSQLSPSIWDGCSPSAVADIRNILQQVKSESEPLFNSRNYPKILKMQQSMMLVLQSRTLVCPTMLTALRENIQKSRELNDRSDQVCLIKYTIDGILREADRKLALQPQTPSGSEASH